MYIFLAMIPTIETERLRLRGWRFEDFDVYVTLATNVDLQKYVGGAKSKEQAWDDFCAITGQWIHRKVGVFLVADKETDKAIGYAGLWYPLDLEVPELCWSLFPGNMGKGYATEAATAARLWAYKEHEYRQLISYVHPNNLASRGVAERLGAKIESATKLRGEDRLLFRHPDLSLT